MDYFFVSNGFVAIRMDDHFLSKNVFITTN